MPTFKIETPSGTYKVQAPDLGMALQYLQNHGIEVESAADKSAREELGNINAELANEFEGNSLGRIIDSAVRGAADTASFGLADEFAALGNSIIDVMRGEPWRYSRRLRQERIQQQIRDEMDPIASATGRIGGGALSALNLLKYGLSAGGQAAARGDSLFQIGLGSAADGAVGGGLYGAGSGQGARDRALQAGVGTVAGAGLGFAAPYAAPAASALLSTAFPLLAPLNPQAYARSALNPLLQRAGKELADTHTTSVAAIPVSKGPRVVGKEGLSAEEMFADGASQDQIGHFELPKAKAQASTKLNGLAESERIDDGAAEIAGRLAELDPPLQRPSVPAQVKAAPPEPLRPSRSELDGLFDESLYPKDVLQRPLPRYDPRQGTSPRLRDNMPRPEVRDALGKKMENGEALGGRRTVNFEPMRVKFVDRHGKDWGNQRFNQLTEYIGGSTALATPERNVRSASYYYHLGQNGLLVPEQLPEGLGHPAQNLYGRNAERIMSGAGLDSRFQPKGASVAANLQGNWDPIQIDRHGFRYFGMLTQDPRFLTTYYKPSKDALPRNIRKEYHDKKITMGDAEQNPLWWDSAPRPNEFGPLEMYLQDIAHERGIAPAVGQFGMYAPYGGHQSWLDATKNRMLVTMNHYGMDGREVVNRFIDATLPGRGGLLTLLGAPPMLAYLWGQRGGEKREGGSDQRL